MDDRSLYYFCLLFSVAGIISLITFSYFTSPEKVEISSIDENDIGSEVEIRGSIENIYESEGGGIFFHVKDEEGGIDVALFSEAVKDMGVDKSLLYEGKEVIIEGEVDMYKGEIQIIPDKVIL